MGEEKNMGLVDNFTAEDRVSVKFSVFYRLMKEAAKAEVMKELAIKLDGSKMRGYVIRKLVCEEKENVQ